MPVVYPDRRPRLHVLLCVVALLTLGSGSYFVWRCVSTPQETITKAEIAATPSSLAPPVALSKAPTNISSASSTASSASGNSSRPAPQWQAMLEPAVVSATRVDSLSAFQVQMEKWSCEGKSCVGDLRIPLSADAGQKHDISASADILGVLQKKLGESDIQVGVRSIHPDSQGVAVSLEFSPDASRQGRFYTDEEIASIRSESLIQGSKIPCRNSAH